MKTQEEFVKDGGAHCPKCDSMNLDAYHLEADGPIAWCTVKCNQCGYEYTDEYTLTGYTPGEGK